MWAERFASVLVEDSGRAVRTVAACIDLNPVRAGRVKDPKEYRLCGYAATFNGVAGTWPGSLAASQEGHEIA